MIYDFPTLLILSNAVWKLTFSHSLSIHVVTNAAHLATAGTSDSVSEPSMYGNDDDGSGGDDGDDD